MRLYFGGLTGKVSQPADEPDPVPFDAPPAYASRARWVTIIPLGPGLLAGSSDLPGGSDGPSFDPPWRLTALRRAGAAFRHARATLFGLAPCGVLPATDVTAGAVRSYRTFSPLPQLPRAVYFLCHCPSNCSARALPGALPFGVRTFLPLPPLAEPLGPARSETGDRLVGCDATIIARLRPWRLS